MVPSPKVATYDLQPEMSAPELADKAVAAIETGKFDMHRASTSPTPTWSAIPASCRPRSRRCEAVDECLGRLVEAVRAAGRRAAGHRRPRQLPR